MGSMPSTMNAALVDDRPSPVAADPYETLPVGLLSVDRRLHVRRANAQGRQLLGWGQRTAAPGRGRIPIPARAGSKAALTLRMLEGSKTAICV